MPENDPGVTARVCEDFLLLTATIICDFNPAVILRQVRMHRSESHPDANAVHCSLRHALGMRARREKQKRDKETLASGHD
jgi:hypothetical protein